MWKRTAQLGGELWRRGLDLWEVRTVGIAEVLDVEEGRTGSNQAGVLGLGMGCPSQSLAEDCARGWQLQHAGQLAGSDQVILL